MNHPQYIFDFDGTLVDSFHSAVGIFNLLADQYHFRKVASDEIDSLRDLTSHEFIQHLKIPLLKIPSILLSARQQMRSKIPMLLPFKHLPEVLLELLDRKITLGILTSNSSENVTEWLTRNNMLHLFKFIHVEHSYFGKKRILKKMIKTYKMDKPQTFYIGDETRDIDAAKGSDINSVAVTWGFNSATVLARHQPQFIVQKPEDLLTIDKNIPGRY